MTLDIEHFHAAAHFKTPSLTSSEYAKAFESTINESWKRVSRMPCA